MRVNVASISFFFFFSLVLSGSSWLVMFAGIVCEFVVCAEGVNAASIAFFFNYFFQNFDFLTCAACVSAGGSFFLLATFCFREFVAS